MKRITAILLSLAIAAVLTAVGFGLEKREAAKAAEAAALAEEQRLAEEALQAEQAALRKQALADLNAQIDEAIQRYKEEQAALLLMNRGPITVDFAYWQSQNSRIVGYLYSPGTVIDYPVIQGSDNTYYLDHDIYGNSDINGCIMLEHLNASDFSDGNSIIYGHHMKNGSMLASIDRYKDSSYYPDHSYMFLYTPTQVYRLDLIAGYSCPHDDEVFYTSLTPEKISRFMAKSTFKTNLTDTSGPYVTLCTCSYEHDNWRYVVVCKKVAI